jgi:hypothetical protein
MINYDDELDRKWAISFLRGVKGKRNIVNGVNTFLDTRDIKDSNTTYGADVECAKNYNPLLRKGNITLPLRKFVVGKYWNDDKITDYIQFTDNTFKTAIYMSDDVIRKYKDNISWNRTDYPYQRETPWKGFTLQECKVIHNSYVEIPKSEVEVWNRVDNYWEKIN